MKRITLISVAVLCISVAQAQNSTREDALAFGLDECIEYALQNNLAMQNAKMDEKIADYKVKETYGIGLPQINGSLDFKDYLSIPKSLIPAGAFGNTEPSAAQFSVPYNSTIGVSFSQLLFDGTYLVGVMAARTYRELSVRGTKRTEIELKTSVQKAYYSVLVSKEKLKLLEANIERLNKTLSEMEVMYKNGLVEHLDLDRTKVLVNNLNTERQNVVRLLELNVDMLKFQIGMPIEANLLIEGNIADIPIAPLSIENNPYQYKSRVEYALLETQKQLNVLDINRYRVAFLPSLAFYGSSNYSYMSEKFSDLYKSTNYLTTTGSSVSYPFPVNVIGLSLSLPIWDSGQKYYRVKSARLALLKTENDISNFKNAANLDIQQSKTMYINSLESLNNQKRNRDLATEVLRVTKAKYAQGMGSNLEVITAETSLKEAETNYITALYDVLIGKVNYLKSTGNLK